MLLQHAFLKTYQSHNQQPFLVLHYDFLKSIEIRSIVRAREKKGRREKESCQNFLTKKKEDELCHTKLFILFIILFSFLSVTTGL